jgi:hypothetical protein
MTLGSVNGQSGILSGTAVRLGTFTGYTDVLGIGFFTGKDYTTLVSSFVGLTNLDSQLVTDSVGNYYGAFDTASTTAGTRLFAWFYDSVSPSGSANWAVVSGGNSGSNESVYNPLWLAVAPAAVEVNVIEVGTLYSKIYASSGPSISILSNSSIDPEGANIALIPEPSSFSLVLLGGALMCLRRRKI